MVSVILATVLCISLEMSRVTEVVQEIWGPRAIVTSSCEGWHMHGSKHYDGDALDFRVRHVSRHKRPALAEAVSEALGSDFDVVLEVDHLHVELDPDD